MESKEHTCCFFGHRKINITDELIRRLKETIEYLITEKKVDTFLFGSKSEFNELCLRVVTDVKNKYSHIRRIYVRAEFPYIDENYTAYLLRKYEHTYYPESIINSGKLVYLERNCEMIDNSSYCVVYYDENNLPPRTKSSKNGVSDYQPNSGTKMAYNYAMKKKLMVINLAESGENSKRADSSI